MKRKHVEIVDEKPKRKNSETTDNSNTMRAWLLLGLGFSVILLIMLVVILVQLSPGNQGISSNIEPLLLSDFTPETEPELIVVQFDELDAVTTQGLYQGVVRLIIEGMGQAGGEDYSDAFYLFARGDGSLYDPPQLEHFDLEIDGQRAIHALSLLDNPPAYNPEHIYVVDYVISEEARPIAFRISDSIVDDNTGEFRIQVYQLSN